MKKKLKDIYQKFDGKLVGKAYAKTCVCKTILKMPLEIAEYITSHCWFVSSMKDVWAFVLTGNDISNQHLIFFK